jgi:uncharacterized protein
MNDFTPLSALIGGSLIGAAAAVFLFTHGRIAGISNLYGGVFRAGASDRTLRVAFLAGLVAAGALAGAFSPRTVTTPAAGLATVVVAGVLVGFGSQLGAGCTSGHGVCGLSRLSARSAVATLTFMGTAFLTVFLAHQVIR